MKHTLADSPPAPASRISEDNRSLKSGLERQRFLNWSLLVIAGLILALGALTVLPPILSESLAAMWPWPTADMILIVVLSLALLTLTGLAHQQRYIAFLRQQFEQKQAEEIIRAKKQTNRMYALLNVTRMLSSTSNLQDVFDGVTSTCVQGFNCHQASLMLFDKETDELVVRSASGASVPTTLIGSRAKIGDGIAGWAARNRQALIVGRDFDLSQYPGLILKNASISSSMVVPILLRDELVGVLNVSSRSRKVNYDKTDLKALEVFAENVGSCIRHTEQATWMRQTVQKLQQSLKARSRQAERPKERTVAKEGPSTQTSEQNSETGEFVIPTK